MKKNKRDITKTYSTTQIVAKLRRLADGLEAGKSFSVQIAGERVRVPRGARLSIEHERGKAEEEIEFQLSWNAE